jgi:uncharacterized membrane protein (DUF106 family)
LSLIIPELLAISLIDVIISISVQRTIIKAEKTFKLQEDLKRIQAELKELMDRKAGAEDLAKKQKELGSAFSATTKHQMRATPVLFVISIAFYFLLLPHLFPSGTATLNLLVTSIKYQTFQDNTYFIIFTFIISITMQMVLQARDRKRFGAKKAAQPE